MISDRGDVETQNRPLIRKYGPLLEVYTPIRSLGDGAPVGAFELYMPYAPVAAAVAHDTHRLYVVLVIGLTVLYGVLFRLVASASRELRRSAEELRAHAARSAHDATHDPLTSLPNRMLFHDRVHQAILASARHGRSTALLLIDLDRFKEINDTLGHHNGDLLLRRSARGCTASLRDGERWPASAATSSRSCSRDVSGDAARRGGRARVHRALERAVRASRGSTLDVEAQHRHRALPDARRRRRDAAAARRRRDVPRQGASSSGHAVYDAERGPVTPRSA